MRAKLLKKLENTVAEGITKQNYRNSLDELRAESRLDLERAEYEHLTAELAKEIQKIKKRIVSLCIRLGYGDDTKKSLTHLIYCVTKQFEKDENGIVKSVLPACNCMFTIEEWDFKGTDALSQS
jgi:hypothetical protein